MPNHEPNSAGAVARRVRRWGGHRLGDLRQPPGRPSGEVSEAPPPAAGVRTTVDATLRPEGTGRYRRLTWAPGEPHVVRDDLGVWRSSAHGTPAPATGSAAGSPLRSLLYLGHHTDSHLCDAQSPARLEGGETFGWVNPGSDGGHRPQETCGTQVLDSLVAATNRVATSPLTGAAMAAVLQTGDQTDNATAAELRWWLDVLAGRAVTPNTGVPGRYEGAQRRPGSRGHWQPDDPRRDVYGRAGFPKLPGLLDAAVQTFQPVGLEVPWLAVFGNHDGLFQGTFGTTTSRLRLDRLGPMLAGTSRKPHGALGLVRAIVHASLFGEDPERWERWAVGPGLQTVTADPDARRSLGVDAFLAAVVADGDHGFGAAHLATNTTWWSRPVADRVQLIGLDTCNHTNGDRGSLGPTQFAWLTQELERQAADGRLVVVCSHHNSATLTNRTEDAHDPGPRIEGSTLVALLARFPNVILWVNGHAHRHQILGHRGTRPGTGFWEVTTASTIDFGQQGRTLEVVERPDGLVSIVVTVLDHAAPPQVPHRQDGGWTPTELASISRELALNDARWIDPIRLLGELGDRNVELLVPTGAPGAAGAAR